VAIAVSVASLALPLDHRFTIVSVIAALDMRGGGDDPLGVRERAAA